MLLGLNDLGYEVPARRGATIIRPQGTSLFRAGEALRRLATGDQLGPVRYVTGPTFTNPPTRITVNAAGGIPWLKLALGLGAGYLVYRLIKSRRTA